MTTSIQKLKNMATAASILLISGITAVPTQAAPAVYSFREIVSPSDAMFTQLLGINNDGVIAGYFGDGTIIANNGFTLTLNPKKFLAENIPGAKQTQVIGINNTLKTAGFFVDGNDITHGFEMKNGILTTLDAPQTNFNQILGVNDLGESAGYSSPNVDGATGQRAFIHNSTGFVYVPFSTFNLTNIGNSQATGINDANIVCGFYVTASGKNVGFVWDMKNKSLKTLNPSGATFTQALGVNNAGQVVGVYSTDNSATTHGFVYKQGSFTTIDEPNVNPNAKATLVNGINDRGQLVGFYEDLAGDTVGFVATPNIPLW